ncbi:TetR/AcrR family transcriptional regulator [uncultured Maricaulis sp.]|uniref:TetR/AcrR family transcriptional regulator n=1 Tax=uncultured Maricaulis sp. TaxID=174710 RepID=UPI0030D73ABD|tara:strand:- start:50494 stop:51069 length:576 start_codon:yes stop_codon:yes gene_type:complete
MIAKRAKLIETATRLFHERGFWDTPTALIAREAGVANGTLFNYFPSKAALVEAVYLGLKQSWAVHLQAAAPQSGSVHDRLAGYWLGAIDWARAHPDRHALLGQLKLSDEIGEGARADGVDMFAATLELIGEAMTSGVIRPIDPGLLKTLAEAQVGAAIQFLTTHPESPVDEIARTSFEIFWRGIALAPSGD